MGKAPGDPAPAWGPTPLGHPGGGRGSQVLGPGPHPGRSCPLHGLGVGSRPCVPALQTEAPGNAASAVLGPLASSTTYAVRVTCLHPGGRSSTRTGRLTTREWAVVEAGSPAAPCPSAPWTLHIDTRSVSALCIPEPGRQVPGSCDVHTALAGGTRGPCCPADGAGPPPGSGCILGRGRVWAQLLHEDGVPLPPSETRASKAAFRAPGGTRPRASASLSRLAGKAPSPSQLSVTELPGDEVRLEWAAAAASGVLVYQIKWLPLGDGKAHEVLDGERPRLPGVAPARRGPRAQPSARSPFPSSGLRAGEPGHGHPAWPGRARGVRDHHPGLLRGRGPQRARVPPLHAP